MKPRLPKAIGKLLLASTLFCSLTGKLYSQAFIFGNEKVKFEAGFCFGPSFFLGDLGGNQGKGTPLLKDWNYETMTLAKGAFFTVYPVRWGGLRLNVSQLTVSGDDALINTMGIDELWRKQRNLDFKTSIWEAAALVELYPTMMFNNAEPDEQPRLRPYVTGGVGFFHFNPQGSLKDANGNKTWYYLQPFRLEGQGMAEYPNIKPYSLTQLNLPFGAGVKYFISDRVNVGMELLYRKTFTDYIDDVSQRYIDYKDFAKYLPAAKASLATQLSDKAVGIIFPGMSRYPAGTQRGDLKDHDTYFTVTAKVGIQLGPIYESIAARQAAKQTRCPAFY